MAQRPRSKPRTPARDKDASAQSKKPRLPRHGPFYVAIAAGGIALLICLWLVPQFAIAIAFNVMFAVYLGLVIIEVPRLTPDYLRSNAEEADTPAAAILLVTTAVVALAVGLLFVALNSAREPRIYAIVPGGLSVLLGWFVIHTMAGLHYAHEYYAPSEESVERPRAGRRRGLRFPEGEEPDGRGFLYLGYTIGAALQVSDVVVTTNAMRRIIMFHIAFSFFFNTAIVAATVNAVVAISGA